MATRKRDYTALLAKPVSELTPGEADELVGSTITGIQCTLLIFMRPATARLMSWRRGLVGALLDSAKRTARDASMDDYTRARAALAAYNITLSDEYLRYINPALMTEPVFRRWGEAIKENHEQGRD